MLRYIVIPGLVYGGETDAEALKREREMIDHNRRMDELEKRNRQPIKSYRQWAKKRGIKF